MKKNLLAIGFVAYSLMGHAQQQIGNGDMELWDAVGSSSEEPQNWNSFKTASGSYNGFGSQQVQRSTAIRPGATGQYCARVWSKSTLGIVANGNLTLGRINMGSTTPADANNYNYTSITDPLFSEAITSSPDSLVFWVKFTAANGNSMARVHAVLHDSYILHDPIDANSTSHVVATAPLNYSPTGGVWVRKSVPFNYTGPSTAPQFLLVTFTTNMTPGGGAANDEVLVDDIQLIYNNDPIVAGDDAITTLEDIAVTIPVTTNDTDPENALDCASISITAQPANGTVTIDALNCSVVYTPNAGFFGTDSFTYSVCDNGTPVTCDNAVVTITVNEVVTGNNPIVANDDNAVTDMNVSVVIPVAANDLDVENQIDFNSISVTSAPSNGTTSINTTTGEITYTPNNGFFGNDSFTYTICDAGTPSATCDAANVGVVVNLTWGLDEQSNILFTARFLDNQLIMDGVKDKEGTFTLFSLNGSVVAKGQLSPTVLTSLTDGMYILLVESEGMMYSKKLIKN
jgi:hypothetical protein